jgi:Concanavalin A-like lectin/glucanases superfamily/Dockerin type I domain
MKYTLFSIVALVTLVTVSSASADTVAYWRWENGTAGTNVPHTGGGGVFDGTTPDVSGNGNDLSVWEEGGGAGYQYRSDVPFSSVPQTGDANNLSVKNTGGGPAMFTNSSVSMPSGVDIETMMPLAFTVEASFKVESGGYRTVVGRDSQGVATTDQALAALYLQKQPDESMAIKFADVAGNFWEAVSAPGLIQGFDFGSDPDGVNAPWYNVAGVSDGSTLKLYVNGQLQASTPIVSADPRLTFGGAGAGDWHPGEWSVGRGLFNGGHGDRAYGFIDEVRISNSALTPSAFLAPPGPSDLQLEVNTITGGVTLTNATAMPVSLDFYRIGSAAGALSLGGWDSLDDQNYDAVDGPDDADSIAGNSPGEGWDQAGGSNAMQLIELFLAENGSSIGAGVTLNLGNAFDTSVFTPGVDGDLEFTYSLLDGLQLTGDVSYVTSAGVSGDYNKDGVVNAADYTVWRNHLGQNFQLDNENPADSNPGVVDQADYAYWKSRFGATSGSGAAAAAAVPEPGSWILVVLAATVLSGRRPTKTS